MTRSDSLLGQALAYASRGWPVFPCLPGAKEPATTHGFHDASTDNDQVPVLVAQPASRPMWRSRPACPARTCWTSTSMARPGTALVLTVG